MARRSVSPTALVVSYFMSGDLVAVEQALVTANAIVKTRREQETSQALSPEPPKRKRVRRAKVAAGTASPAAPSIAASTTVAAAQPPTTAAQVLQPVVGKTQQEAIAQSPRRRTGPVAVPAQASVPVRKRVRRTKAQIAADRAAAGAPGYAPQGAPVASAAGTALPPPLPPQTADDDYEPISTVTE